MLFRITSVTVVAVGSIVTEVFMPSACPVFTFDLGVQVHPPPP